MIEIKKTTECCACEACVNACPRQAIEMRPDKKGFLFPNIDPSRCVDCGLCEKVCPLKNEEKSSRLLRVYAVVNRNVDQLYKSASGGAFSALAYSVINKGGVVFGCAWDNTLKPHHIHINKVEDIPLLQGSKYVQSRIGTAYKEVKECLKQGKHVLFSGTPCQCAGLRMYLGKEYEKLECVELICHGVPSAIMFREYLDFLEKQINGKIIDVQFRDKKRGWGTLLHITFKNQNGIVKHKYISVDETFYYYYFVNADLSRECCYECPYASLPRKSDLTIGDFWGIDKTIPDMYSKNGVSIVVVNTEKGKRLLDDSNEYIDARVSTVDVAITENEQLASHSNKGLLYNHVWNLYLSGGVEAVNKDYINNNKNRIIKGFIKRNIPIVIKNWAKKIIIH